MRKVSLRLASLLVVLTVGLSYAAAWEDSFQDGTATSPPVDWMFLNGTWSVIQDPGNSSNYVYKNDKNFTRTLVPTGVGASEISKAYGKFYANQLGHDTAFQFQSLLAYNPDWWFVTRQLAVNVYNSGWDSAYCHIDLWDMGGGDGSEITLDTVSGWYVTPNTWYNVEMAYSNYSATTGIDVDVRVWQDGQSRPDTALLSGHINTDNWAFGGQGIQLTTWSGLDRNPIEMYWDNVGVEGALQPIPGDANSDRKVNVVDLGILATNYGTIGTATWAMGDFNNDTIVNVVDLGILATNYGYGMDSGSEVPEPMSLGLLGFGGLTLLRRKR